MIAHNNKFNEHIDAAASAGTQPGIREYQDWALQIRQLAEQIEDPALADPARALANQADEGVIAIEGFLEDPDRSADRDSPAPQWAKDYSRVGEQFNATLTTLDQKCPA